MRRAARLLRGPLALAVALAVVGAGAWPAPPVRAADSSSDIPGVPLAAGSVTGIAGGDAIDAVYRIVVGRQTVIQASLTGSAGTDFDLYLYDSSATTVNTSGTVGQDGLVAKSAGPTSAESLSHPSQDGGIYYLDISSYGQAVGFYTLSWAAASDTTPPRVSLSLDGGARLTRDAEVLVAITATDDLSGVANLAFSQDGQAWGDWQSYAPTTSWTFAALDGSKRLCVRARDTAGNVSPGACATIVLDTTRPVVASWSPAPGGFLPSSGGTVAVTFSEPIVPSSFTNYGLVLQDENQQFVVGSWSYDASTRTGTFRPSGRLVAGAAYFVSLYGITDLAGNTLAGPTGWSLTAVLVPEMTLSATPASAKAPWSGAAVSVVLAGSTDTPILGPYTLERSVAGGPWTAVGPLVPDPSSGTFTASAAVRSNTAFRIHYPGSTVTGEGWSPAARVLVSRSLRLVGGSTGTPVVTARNVTRSLVAALAPAYPNVVVTAAISRWTGTAWVVTARLRATSSGGRAVFAWRPTRAGSYRVVLSTGSSALFTAGRSPTYKVTVR